MIALVQQDVPLPAGADPLEPVEPLPFPLEARSDERHPRLAVVVPVFNEEAVLERTARELKETLDALDVEWTVLFVNDGSADASARVLEQLHRREPRFEYLVLSRNFGHQAALTAGLDHARGEAIVTMDADLQHPPALLATLLAGWRQGYDIVHTRKVTTEGLPAPRRLATRLAYSTIRRLAGLTIIPQASDFRLLDARVASALRSLPEVARLYRGLTPWVGFRQAVVPYVAAPRAAGRSQYSLRQLVALFARALFDFSDVFLHAGLAVGALGLLLSGAYLVFILAWLLLGRTTPPGWASSISVTLLLSSMILFFVGILGVYVARIYREVRHRPAYIVSLERRTDRGTDAP
jgi:dolichol-phosphate mannosyltransferase